MPVSGGVKYADPKNRKYPVDTKAHARAAWGFINHPRNAAEYPLNGVSLAGVKRNILAAAHKFGVTIKATSKVPSRLGDTGLATTVASTPKHLPSGTWVSWPYRGATGHGQIAGFRINGGKVEYKIRQVDNHVSATGSHENTYVWHFADVVTVHDGPFKGKVKDTSHAADGSGDIQLGKQGSKWKHGFKPVNAKAVAMKVHHNEHGKNTLSQYHGREYAAKARPNGASGAARALKAPGGGTEAGASAAAGTKPGSARVITRTRHTTAHFRVPVSKAVQDAYKRQQAAGKGKVVKSPARRHGVRGTLVHGSIGSGRAVGHFVEGGQHVAHGGTSTGQAISNKSAEGSNVVGAAVKSGGSTSKSKAEDKKSKKKKGTK